MFEHQLPVFSPLSLTALFAGFQAALFGGEKVRQQVSAQLRDRFSASAVVLTDSGTTALRLGLLVGSVHRDGPAVMPAYNCYDLATAADGAGVGVTLYDIEPTTLGPEPRSLERALDTEASSLVVAPLYGIPVNLDMTASAARNRGVLFIEDAAQAGGAKWKEKQLGCYGDLTVLSFSRGKGITGGGGGALLIRSPELEYKLDRIPGVNRGGRGWLALSKATAQWLLGRPKIYGLPVSLPFLSLGETVYQRPHSPTGIHASCAGVLSQTLKGEQEEVRRRRSHARELLELVEEAPGLEAVRPTPGGDPGWLRLPVLARTVEMRNRLTAASAQRAGVMPAYPEPLNRLEGFSERCTNAGEPFDGADELASSLFTFPTHGQLTRDSFKGIAGVLQAPGSTVRSASVRKGK